MRSCSTRECPVGAVAVTGARPAAAADDHGARGARAATVADRQGGGRREARAALEVDNRAVRSDVRRAVAARQEQALPKAVAIVRQQKTRRPVRATGTVVRVIAAAEADRLAANRRELA